MARICRETLLKRLFSDKKHYPYGFSRSGDFSIRESQLLQQYGTVMDAIQRGDLEPSTQEERNCLKVVAGERDPQTPLEKTWMKYQTRIHRPKMASIYGSKPVMRGDVANEANDDDLNTSLDGMVLPE
ncbi:DUF413 domain-containing protein [Alteromonas halophila]|uniref:Macrodomain Ori protein n=1 Tax=Alteromonas halophila TaxID=516698 RepID=A0A918MXH6_9ALTE|nr:DUF413 domain-containing protein [Alteromonas halophila]GGW79185.1 hypothetical protein GCM10007391_09870 [Alteromonas halophila]